MEMKRDRQRSGGCEDNAIEYARLRRKAVDFLIRSCGHLGVTPIVKYTSLTLFADRFIPSLLLSDTNSNHHHHHFRGDENCWLLQQPWRECNFQLFALVSLWISTKMHDTGPLSVQNFKSLGDNVIRDQHFTTRDFVQAEVVFMQVIGFELGASNIAFVYLEKYLNQFRQLARVGELLSFDACMDIMDILYETEEMSILYDYPSTLAAAVLVVSYIITIPKQQSEFPLLPWVKALTSCKVNEMEEFVNNILDHVLQIKASHSHS